MQRSIQNTTGDASTTIGSGLIAVEAGKPRRKRSSGRPPWMEEPSKITTALKALALGFIAIVMIFPFLNVLAVSLSSYEDILGGGLILFPKNPTLDAYRTLFNGDIVVRALQVSAGLTIFGTLLQMTFTTTMAWGLSRPNVPGSRAVLIVVLMAMLIAPGLIPMFLLIKELGLLNSYPSLIVPGLISSFNLIIIRQFFMNLPQDLIDSAKLDGASEWKIFTTIALPLSKAVMAVIGLFYAVGIWNSWFNALLYISDAEKWPVQMVLRQYVLMGASVNAADFNQTVPLPPQTLQMAIVVVATVPILIVYPFLQRYFTQGVLSGAIKG
jgi:ABC-type glycerol-3-phosphate transport system permease component